MTGAFRWTPELAEALRRFLVDSGIDLGPFRIEPVGDGHSNLTYLLRGEGNTLVLRRPPAPPLPPGANDVLREADVLDALQGSAVPVPQVVARGQLGDVFDVPFFVMTYSPGVVVTDRTPDAIATPKDRRRIGDSLVDALVALHGIDWRAAGVRGRPEGANLRHHARFGRLVAREDGSPPPDFAELDAWLVAHAPVSSGAWATSHAPEETGAALLHNDLRLGNVLVASTSPTRITAVLDWELAAVGDPLADLGYLLASWPRPGREPTPVQAFGLAALEPGFPGVPELAARYADRSGRDLSALRWHVVNAQRKLAVLYEYNRRRGTDPYYADAAQVRAFLGAAAAAIEA